MIVPVIHKEKDSNTSECNNISYCSSNDCDNIEIDLEDAKKYVLAYLLANIDLIYSLTLKIKISGSFKKYHALEEISTQNGPFNFYSNSMSLCVSQ